jgi:hypothetical protein
VPYLPFEAELHTLLVCSPCVLQSEWHFHIAETIEGGDERGGRLVHLSKGYLVINWVGIQEIYKFAHGIEVNNLVDSRKRERIFRANLVQAHVINTHPPFLVLLWQKNWIGYPVWLLDLFNEASGQKLG